MQVMPVLGLLLLFQYTVLLGPPPFTGLLGGPGWPLLALKGWFGARQHLSKDMEARASSLANLHDVIDGSCISSTH